MPPCLLLAGLIEKDYRVVGARLVYYFHSYNNYSTRLSDVDLPQGEFLGIDSRNKMNRHFVIKLVISLVLIQYNQFYTLLWICAISGFRCLPRLAEPIPTPLSPHSLSTLQLKPIDVEVLLVQWDPVNLVTNGSQKSGHINWCGRINGFFNYENDRLSF